MIVLDWNDMCYVSGGKPRRLQDEEAEAGEGHCWASWIVSEA